MSFDDLRKAEILLSQITKAVDTSVKVYDSYKSLQEDQISTQREVEICLDVFEKQTDLLARIEMKIEAMRQKLLAPIIEMLREKLEHGCQDSEIFKEIEDQHDLHEISHNSLRYIDQKLFMFKGRHERSLYGFPKTGDKLYTPPYHLGDSQTEQISDELGIAWNVGFFMFDILT